MTSRARHTLFTVAIAFVASGLCLVLALPADAARTLYVANGLSAGPGTLPQFGLSTSGRPSPLDPPEVETGDQPKHLALTSNGKFAYATATGSGQTFAYSVKSDGGLEPLPVPSVAAGIGAHGVVVSPDDRSVYVGNQDPGTVSQYDRRRDGSLVPKQPASVASGPSASGLAMTPDGSSLFATNLGTKTVSQFDVEPGTGALVPKRKPTVKTPAKPSGLAISPDGRSLYVATLTGRLAQFNVNRKTGALSPKNPATVAVGLAASGVAITPDGTYLYTPNSAVDTVSQFRIAPDTGRLIPLKPASVRAGDQPEGVAMSPDGRSLYVADAGADTVRWLTVRANGRLTGGDREPMPSAPGPHGLVVSPDRSPVAHLKFRHRKIKTGVPLRLDARSSTDSDGSVARYRWHFGDGHGTASTRPRTTHHYIRPGRYLIRLTVVDNEGCSISRIYTGQSALCSGSRRATVNRWIRVASR